MRVLHHGADRGVSRRAAIAAVVRGEEVDLHAVEKRSDLVVVGSDLAVAVEEEDVGMRSAAQVQARAHGDAFFNGDQNVLHARDLRRVFRGGARWRAILPPWVKEEHQDLGAVQSGKISGHLFPNRFPWIP